jgi:hypothetical protein
VLNVVISVTVICSPSPLTGEGGGEGAVMAAVPKIPLTLALSRAGERGSHSDAGCLPCERRSI